MRQLVVNIAMSLDGFIARNDGSYDWIVGQGDSSFDTPLQFDNDAFFKCCDTVIMGRKSFDDCPLEFIEDFENKTFYIASRQERGSHASNIYFTNDIINKVKELKEEEGGPIWLFGGAELVQSMIAEDLIDHYIIGIIPTILGQGRPLFKEQKIEHKLKLMEATISDGIAMLRYDRR